MTLRVANWRISSAIFRAISKLVYPFGIPSSDPQTPNNVDFWCKLSSLFVFAEPQERCFELFRIPNSQIFRGLCSWTTVWKDYSTHSTQTTQLHNSFSPCYADRKTDTPKKFLDTALTRSHSDVELNC